MRKRKSAGTEQPLLLTIDQARSLLQIGRDAMRALIASGTIKPIEFGRSIRIPRQALVNFIEAQTERAG